MKSNDGKLARVRVRRGTRFQPGDALGTVNRMYHVHLIVGPSGAEINPLSLSPVGFRDTIAPTIEKDGIQLFNESGNRFTEKRNGRLLVHGRVRIVVDAFGSTDLSSKRRRLGLYRLGYQLFKSNDEGATPDRGGPRLGGLHLLRLMALIRNSNLPQISRSANHDHLQPPTS